MVILCWAAKGGSGATVVAAALALTSGRPTLLVDLDGELPAALGIPEPDRPGIDDWLASDAPASHLSDLQIALDPHVDLLPFAQLRTDGRRGTETRPSRRAMDGALRLAGRTAAGWPRRGGRRRNR